jgi:ribosomal protein S18 acetylase RimI-like enzyme
MRKRLKFVLEKGGLGVILFMFALLRSSACSIRQATTTSIQLRLATRTDVPAIQRCNLACLPENYNSHFYCSHLRQWPDLALVAEEISHPHSSEISEERQQQSRNPFTGGFSAGQNEPKIVAYVLGKVESRPFIDYDDPTSSHDRVERLGHVTSLAVQKEFRRSGLARSLMDQLHHHLQHHGIASCGLHVRTSNLAACRLYQEDGYHIDQTIKSYYQDGEDAYFMRRIFSPESSTSFGYGSNRFVRKAWLSGPKGLRLPRNHNPNTDLREDSSIKQSGETGSPELLSGTI